LSGANPSRIERITELIEMAKLHRESINPLIVSPARARTRRWPPQVRRPSAFLPFDYVSRRT
jgi:hypothetical protein